METGSIGPDMRKSDLIIVDIQNDYFPDGLHPLVDPEAAATAAASAM